MFVVACVKDCLNDELVSMWSSFIIECVCVGVFIDLKLSNDLFAT